MNTKRIMCYGDSNTFGSTPITGVRLPEDIRWTGICQNLLGDGYRVLEEGLPGRTTIYDDPLEVCMNGLTGLGYALCSQKPLDLVVVMLGANDVKFTDAAGSAKGIDTLLHHIYNAATLYPGSCPVFRDNPRVLVIAPPPFLPQIDIVMAGTRFEGTYPHTLEFASRFRAVAEQYGAYYLDASKIVQLSPIDCVHMDKEGHRKLGTAIAGAIRDIFEKADC